MALEQIVICPKCHGAASIEGLSATVDGHVREMSCDNGCGRFETIRAWGSRGHELKGWIDGGPPQTGVVVISPKFTERPREKLKTKRDEDPMSRPRYTPVKRPFDAQYIFGPTFYKRGLRDRWFSWDGSVWRLYIHDSLPRGADRL